MKKIRQKPLKADETKDPKEILKAPYSRMVTPQDNGTYMGEILEFRGCLSQGDTPSEALALLERVAQDWIAIAIEYGKPIPLPLAGIEHSGHLALRMPKSLHRQAALAARRDGSSLNQFINAAVAVRVGAEDAKVRKEALASGKQR